MFSCVRDVVLELLTRYRGAVVLLFVLPVGLVFDACVRLAVRVRALYVRHVLREGLTHDERVGHVVAQVRRWRAQRDDERRPMCTARPSWLNLSTRFVAKRALQRIDLSRLHHVLDVDVDTMSVYVEPNVCVGDACAVLNPRGLTLATCLELRDASLGGLALAVGMTTASHRHGLLHETVVEYELVSADGELLRVRADNEHAELFRALPWSHGTLGFVVGLRLAIERCTPLVRLRYTVFDSLAAVVDRTRAVAERRPRNHRGGAGERAARERGERFARIANANASANANAKNANADTSGERRAPDFVETMLFAPHGTRGHGNAFACGVLVEGDFVDDAYVARARRRGVRVNRLDRWWAPWWFKQVEHIAMSARSPRHASDDCDGVDGDVDGDVDGSGVRGWHQEELVPLTAYMLRHERPIFWVAQHLLPFGNAAWFRFAFGWLMPPKPAFLKFTTTPAVRRMTLTHQVFQDLMFHLGDVERAVRESLQHFGVSPILVYPCRLYRHGGAGVISEINDDDAGTAGTCTPFDITGHHQGQLRSPRDDQLVVIDGERQRYAMYSDVGIYGVPSALEDARRSFHPTRAYRHFEALMRECNAYPFLYADTLFTEAEFGHTFDLALYRRVRQRYGIDRARAFPSLFDKIRPEIDAVAVCNDAATLATHRVTMAT